MTIGRDDHDTMDEAEFLRRYAAEERGRYPRAEHTVDIVLCTILNGEMCVLLVRRGQHPYKGRWALPGGFVDLGDGESGSGEDPDDAAYRELAEETGVDVFRGYLEQLRTYGAPGRDPRGRVFSTAYVGIVPHLPDPVGGDDADDAHFFAVADLGADDGPALAFDHARIIADGIERVRGKIEYEGRLAAAFLGEKFTVPELRRVYEAVWGGEVHRADFRRKVLSVDGFLVPLDDHVEATGGPPARLYRLGDATVLHPPMLRSAVLLSRRDADA